MKVCLRDDSVGKGMALASKPDALKWVHMVEGENRHFPTSCALTVTHGHRHRHTQRLQTNKRINKRKNSKERQQLSSQEAAEEDADRARKPQDSLYLLSSTRLLGLSSSR